MFKYRVNFYSTILKQNSFFDIVSKNDKEAIKKANELYFKCFLLNVSKYINGNYLIIQKFN